MYYKIGEFSKVTGLSIRTLRFYDKINLLKPHNVDVFTGYREYDQKNLEDFRQIEYLKEVGFKLEQIKQYLNCLDREILFKQREELVHNLTKIEKQIRTIDYFNYNLKAGKIVINKENKILKGEYKK